MSQSRRWPARILHVTPFLWSGAGGALVRLVEAQRADGAAVRVATTGRSAGGEDWLALRRRLQRAGVRLERIDFYSREMPVFWDGVRALAGLVHAFSPDIVHTHAGVPACAMAVVRAQGRWRGTFIAHLNSWGIGRPAWMDRMDAQGLQAADRVVCISRAYARRLATLGVPRSRIEYLPWGIDLAERVDGNRDQDAASNVIGFVGRIEARKNQVALVQAFAHVRRGHPDLQLHLVGPVAEPEYDALLTKTIDDLGIRERVVRHDHVRDVLPLLRTWRVFVSASLDEGQGLAVLEAMAAGVPVVAVAARGIEDYLVDGRTGVLVPTPAPMPLARGIARLLDDPGLARTVARHARAVIDRRYRWEVALAALARIYRGDGRIKSG